MRRRSTIAAGIAARGVALFLAAFTIAGLIGEARGRATDLGLWFVDIRDLARPLQVVLLGLFGGSLLGWVLTDRPGTVRRRIAGAACLGFAALALRDVVRFATAIGTGLVRPTVPIPLALLIVVGLVLLGVWILRERGLGMAGPRRIRTAVLGCALVVGITFPVAQIGFFGTTDYRRPADAAVVFGARVYSSGAPSPLLADRIATGVELYQAGLVPILIMSGGDGTDGFNEAAVMAERAIAAGVPPSAVLVDPAGINTDATVDHALGLILGPGGLGRPLQPSGSLRLIAVSQAYHLPRIQLAFSGVGIDVLTVPAIDPIPIREMPLLITREIPAFWLYYLRACLG